MCRILSSLILSATLLAVVGSTQALARRYRRPRVGYLELVSKTDGAQVFIDGLVVGRVPLDGPIRLKRGEHTLKITLKGYTQFLDVVRIVPGKPTKLEIDLIPIGGVLKVSVRQAGARVFVDGTFVGIAPVEAEALVGARTVRVSKAGFHDFIRGVRVVAGKQYTILAKLKPLPTGSTPYRPAPPPPPEWYEKWYVWAGAAAGVTAVAIGIIVPVLLTQGDPIDDFGGLKYTAK